MRRGATLIEVLIAVGVSAMLTGIVIVYGSGGRHTTALYVETVKLAQTILRAKSQAVLIYYNPANPVCGYGIRTISQPTPAYALFRYTALAGESCDDIPSIDSARYVEVQRFPLSDGISFTQASTTLDTILFVPPDPLTMLWKQGVRIRPAGVIMFSGGGGNTRSVTITTSGQISY